MLTLLLAALLTLDSLPLPDPPALVTRIGSPAFRTSLGGSLYGGSADGKRVYTATHWGCSGGVTLTQLLVWDAQTGKLLHSYDPTEKAGRISRMRFTSDGLRVVVDARDDDALGWKYRFRLLDPDTGRVIREGKPWVAPPARALGFGDELRFLDETSTDRWAIVNTEKEVVLLDIENGKVVSFAPTVPIEKGWIQVAPDGGMALTASGKSERRLYDLPDGKLRAEWLDGEQRQTVGFTHDGKALVGWTRLKGGWALEIREFNGQTRTVLENQPEPGNVEFAPNGKVFVLRSSEREGATARDPEVRETATGKLLFTLPNSEDGSRLLFSPDSHTIWTWPGGGTIVPWDIATGRPRVNGPDPPGPVERYRFLSEDKLVGLTNGFVITWNPITGKEQSRVRVPRSINWSVGVAFNPAGDRLVYTDTDRHLVSWDYRNGAETRTPLPAPAKDTQQALAPGGEFVFGRTDDTLIVRTTADAKPILERAVPDMDGVREWLKGGHGMLATSANRQRLAVAGFLGRNPFALVDLNDPKAVALRVEPPHVLESLAMSPDGRFVAVAGIEEDDFANRPTLLTVWDVKGRKVASLAIRTDALRALGFSPDGSMLAAVSYDRVVIVDCATWKIKANFRAKTRGGWFWFAFRQQVAWSPSGKLFAVQTDDERLAVWDVTKLDGK